MIVTVLLACSFKATASVQVRPVKKLNTPAATKGLIKKTSGRVYGFSNENRTVRSRFAKNQIDINTIHPVVPEAFLDGNKCLNAINDDDFKTTNTFKKSIRDMLINGSSIFTFEFRDDNSVVHLTIEITAL